MTNRRKLLAEGGTIVVSILLAFGIDALWEERRERADEQEAITQLVADFQTNSARLDSVRGVHEQALDASYTLLGLTTSSTAARDVGDAAGLVRSSWRVWTYDPVLGGINSLVQSGRLGLIRNDSLRVAIAGWPDLVDDLNEEEVYEANNTFERLAPFLIERGVMLDLLLAAGALDRLGTLETPDVSGLLTDPTYSQMLAWRIIGLENVLSEYDLVGSEILKIQRLLDGRPN